MFNRLTGLGLAIVVFAVLLGAGSVMLQSFGEAVAGCTTDYTWNTSSQTCMNTSGSSLTETGGLTNTKYMQTQLGSTSGGLASWAPAIIALTVGLVFIGAFMFRNSGKGRY